MLKTPTLEDRYAAILDSVHPDFLTGKAFPKLSTPFLVSPPHDQAARKVMVVGRECGAPWRVGHEGAEVRAYIAAALKHHECKFKAWMEKRQRGATFFNFMRQIEQKVGRGGLIYSNLFAFDFDGQDPRACKEHYESVIEPLSRELLKAQIDHFRPDLIIFANGVTSMQVRRRIFPHAPGVVKGGQDWSAAPHSIPNSQLWEFELYGRYRCLRIQHPSNYSKPAARARQFLVDRLLPAAP